MRKFLTSILRAVAVLGVVFAAASCGGVKQSALDKIVEEMNKECPMVLDETVTMDKVESSEGMELKVYYTTNVLDASDESEEMALAKEAMKGSLRESTKTEQNFAPLRALGVTFTYIFRDENGGEIINYSVTPEMYK